MNAHARRNQAVVIFGLLLACAGMGLLIGYDQPEVAVLGLVIFAIAAVLVCKLDNVGD